MNLRKALPSDASALAALSIEVWLGTYLRAGINSFFANFVLSEFTAAKMADAIDDPDTLLWVSENRQGIDGYLRLSLNATPALECCSETEIVTLYVQPRHHGRGIGRALLAACFAECEALGVSEVWLTTNHENAPAIAFYKSLGFANPGQTHFRIGDESFPNEVFTRAVTPPL